MKLPLILAKIKSKRRYGNDSLQEFGFWVLCGIATALAVFLAKG